MVKSKKKHYKLYTIVFQFIGIKIINSAKCISIGMHNLLYTIYFNEIQ